MLYKSAQQAALYINISHPTEAINQEPNKTGERKKGKVRKAL